MHVGDIDVLYEVFVTGSTSLHTYATSVLEAVLGKRCPLDISEVRDCDHYILVCVEVLRIELFCRECDLRPSLVSVFLFHLKGLVLDDAQLHALVCKNILAVLDELHELVVLALEFLSFESSELAEPHLDDCSGLRLRECECRHELALCIVHVL